MKCKGYNEDISFLNKKLRVSENYDIVQRELVIGSKKSTIFFVDGFVDSSSALRLCEDLLAIKKSDLSKIRNLDAFSRKFIPYIEVDTLDNLEKIEAQILTGGIILLIEGLFGALFIDIRTYPMRGVEEPDSDKVLRGSRDGFIETLVMNTALIRRRIRDRNLTIKYYNKGRESKTDIALCYHESFVDRQTLNAVKKKLEQVNVRALTMSQESLAESLIGNKWYNPFPKVRYTDRPDVASASILEGSVIILVDNSPSAMIFPVAFFDFLQDANDYYFPPFTGTYLRLVRTLVFFSTIFITPIWFYFIQNPQLVSANSVFLKIKEANDVHIFFQLILIEIAMDGLKLASLNTPSVLGNSFSVIAALLLGEFSVKAGWFVPEAILIMAFVTVANFAQPSFELGYAFKFMRILLLSMIMLFNTYGLVLGIILIFKVIATNKTISNKSYFYPLIPLNIKKLGQVFYRRKIKNK